MSEGNPVRDLDIKEALMLHVEIMERTGTESQGVRSVDLLESALNRPRTARYYAGADLIAQAARLAAGISRSQAFVEGNKRTAFVLAVAFLKLNGLTFASDPLQFAEQLDQLADPAIGDDEADERFEAWLRDHVVVRDRR